MSNIIDWSQYGHISLDDEIPKNIRWEVTYQGNGRGDGIKITAIFAPENLDDVVASIKRQIESWKNEPK